MRKGLKILSTSLLLSTLFVAGCSCGKDEKTNVSRIDNSDEALATLKGVNVEGYTLLDVYNTLIAADAGNVAVANKLIELVANEVLDISNNESVWKARYEKIVKEKLEELAKSESYEVKGEFSEKLMESALKAEGYSITCTAGNYGTVDNLACDYSDYVNENIKIEALSTLLKQKYILEETLVNRTNTLTNKKIRDVEYFTVTSSLDDTYEDLKIRDFMRSLRDKIAANEQAVVFSEVESELKEDMKDIVDKEYAKIGTKDDYSQSIFAAYTNNFTQDKSKGYQDKLDAINEGEYTFTKVISADSAASAVVSETITSALLAINDPSDASFSRRAIKVGDYYYLVNPNAGVEVDAKDILLSETSDASVYTYSIVRFKVINSSTQDEAEIYKAVELLAENSTLASSALSHYIEEKKDAISVYDDNVKAYLEKLYPDIFAE